MPCPVGLARPGGRVARTAAGQPSRRRPVAVPRAARVRRQAARCDLYYFAFGSNVNTLTLTRRRGIEPIKTERCVLENWRLEFSVPGFGPWEPSFATVARAPEECCHGMAFLVTDAQWEAIKRSEGVSSLAPAGYQVVDVSLRSYDGADIRAKTLTTGVRVQGLRPSARYLDIIREGALEWNLDAEWQAWLNEEVGPAPKPPDDPFELASFLAEGMLGGGGAERGGAGEGAPFRTFAEWRKGQEG